MKALEQLSNIHSINSVFDDFLQMSVCAFSFGKMEERYLEIAKRYKAEELDLFGQALGEMVINYDKKSSTCGGWFDYLGHYFETIQSHFSASARGQFFTPESICNLMAQIVDDDGQSKDLQFINDCSCGSGRNLIAHSRTNTNKRFNSFYVAQDIDSRCVNMCVLNFVMYGMSGVVIHMDTLRMLVYGGYRVYLPETGLFVQPLTVEECYNYVRLPFDRHDDDFKKVEDETPYIIPSSRFGEQLSLF